LINYDSTPAHLNATDRSGNTAIVLATLNNQPAVVQILLDKGADPNIKGFDKETALQIAKRKKYPEIEKILSAKPK
jgi:ankyrin repeat protein